MDRDKMLRDIGLELETFQAHIKKIRKHGSLHKLDVELLQDKTKKIYDQLLILENDLQPEEKHEVTRSINLPEKMPEAEIPEKVESKKAEPPGKIVREEVPKKVLKPEAEKEKEETSPPPAESSKATPVTGETPQEPKKEVAGEALKDEPSPPSEPVSEPSPVEAEKPKSTFDLFSSNAGETIGDKLGGNDNASIADQMQQRAINDLKQAIGINEKFLFINELFGGDLGKYNKAIEEFNGLQTQEGVRTHLVELKVQYQWDEANEAYQKFSGLLERKFG